MLSIHAENDLVILDLHGRRRDVLLSPLSAARMADVLREKAALAETAAPTLARGESWEVQILSFDGRVTLRFTPPFGVACSRVPMPAGIARRLADELDFKAIQAGYKMRFCFH